jgi:hypothetical protein
MEEQAMDVTKVRKSDQRSSRTMRDPVDWPEILAVRDSESSQIGP